MVLADFVTINKLRNINLCIQALPGGSSMFVSVIPEKKMGRKLIIFVEGYRDGKRVRQRKQMA